MKRNKIIKHYKSFFGLEDMGLAENDHLMIDWAESLVKDCNLHIVNGSALDATFTIKQATEAMIKFGEAARKWLDSEDGKKVTDAVKSINQHCR